MQVDAAIVGLERRRNVVVVVMASSVIAAWISCFGLVASSQRGSRFVSALSVFRSLFFFTTQLNDDVGIVHIATVHDRRDHATACTDAAALVQRQWCVLQFALGGLRSRASVRNAEVAKEAGAISARPRIHDYAAG